MLKLEKTSQLSGLTVRLREREHFFEPRLLKALAIAVILHCGALLLFHVTPFTFSSTFVFFPIQVQSDHPLQEGSISALVASYREENNELMPPPPTVVPIPTLNWISFPQESNLTPALALDLHAFQSLEERFWPKWQEPLSLQLEEPKIQLSISGDLAELSLVSTDSLLNQMQPISVHSSPVYVIYQVQMDEKTGKLFWYERIQSSGMSEVDRLTEKILMNLRFSLPNFPEQVLGTLNFAILTSKEN